ncbi:unnamed protein product [Rotaria sordida]|uniref:Uncharacterized protein n=1 Tax=Rotaria sordida TaxID=392033 RepID=A0A815PYW5_9BILA|nr:unnamed protein product [Rotaria sordida]CAF4071645.1 unnamed protein product [Rotaria sordida]
MSKKSIILSPLKRPSTRSLSSTKPSLQQDKYTFQSDDEDHYTKPILIRKSNTPIITTKRPRGRPPKTPKIEEISTRTSISSINSEIEEKKRSNKRSYEKPVTRRASRLGSQTNTPVNQIREKIKINSTPPIIITPKKRGRKPKMLSTTPLISTDEQQKNENENLLPSSIIKRQYIKKSLEDNNNNNNNNNNTTTTTIINSKIDEKDLMQFGSPEQDDFSDDSVDFVWKGSSKMAIEILKRRIPKDDQYSSLLIQSDPTAQRKRAIIPRLTNFDALSGQPTDNTITTNDNNNNEERLTKKSNSIITLNNAFQNDFDYSYNDTGTKMSTTTTTTQATDDDKPRPRVYAVKSTTMKSRLQQQQQQQQQPDIKRPKWMNDQQGKPDDDDDEEHIQTAGEEPNDYDYVPKGQYMPKRPNYRGRGTYPGRRGTGMRGRPPGSRRHWTNDDDDDDYDQYEETNSRYGPRKQTPYRSTRPMYDMADDDDYDKNRRMSLTQAYRRSTDIRQPIGNRRIGINNGNHPIYKDDDYYQQQQQQQQQSRSTTTTLNRLPTTHSTSMNTGNTFVAKINDAQLSEVANQSQIFFVNMPQQDQKNQQVLSVLASEQQQVLPVAVVQQAKVETQSSSTTNSTTSQNQTLAFTVKLPVDTPKQKKILPKPSSSSTTTNSQTNSMTSTNANKPFAWSRPPGRIQLNNDEQNMGKGLTITPINTDLDTMEAAHVLATAADVTMAADARRKAQQHDDDMTMITDETPSNIANEETVQCEDDGQKNQMQQIGTITANIIDENGVEHTVLLSTEEAQQLLGSQGAIIVDGDGQPISIQPAQTQTYLSPFALDQAQLQALLTQAGIDPNTPLTIEQIDPNQQQQVATLCTSPGGTQYTVLTQGPAQQQQFILQPALTNEPPPPPPPPQPIAPKEDPSSPPKRRAFAVKSTIAPTESTFDDMNMNERPRRKIFATKSTVSPIEQIDDEGITGTRAYHRK